MILPMLSLPLVLQGSLVILLLLLLWRLSGSSSRLPPGPNPIPILGNLRLPNNYRTALEQWAAQYEDIMTLRILGRPFIVINSKRAASEILEKRAGSTFTRPRLVMAQELVGMKSFPSQNNDPTLHKQYRRFYTMALSPRATQAYWTLQVNELRRATLDMLTSPQNHIAALERAVAAIAFLVAYGYDIEKEDDMLIKKIHMMMRIFLKVMTPGAYLVDIIPLLKYVPEWFPGAKFKRDAAKWKEHIRDIGDIPFDRVKRDIASGNVKPSFTSNLLEAEEDGQRAKKYEEHLIKWSAGGIYNAGSDTSAAAIHNFLAAMILYPNVQTKAQVELDNVVGRERPPTIEDRENLPYCWAIVHELLRWQPIVPLALPHCLDRDEEFEGYLLPKGATVLANVWAMSRDETEYPSAKDFVPERYLAQQDKSLQQTTDTSRKLSFGFGYGRRICPGAHLAEATVFAAVVSILWSSNISSTVGETPDIQWVEGLKIHRPQEFPVDFKSRFPAAVEILRNSIND